MMRKILPSAAIAALLMLATSSPVRAYGAFHRGYTSVSPSGVSHYGSTTAAGPYGAYHHTGETTVGAGGVQHYGSTTGVGGYGAYGSTSYRNYSPAMYGGYSAAGYSGAAYSQSVMRAGYYRP